MRQAAERLHAAGMRELAERLAQEAGKLAHAVRAQRHGEELQHVIRELREEVGRLKGELEQTRRRVQDLSGERNKRD